MNFKIKLYLQDTSLELREKVSWPTWAELQESAMIVLIASLIIAILIFAMDKVSSSVLNQFYKLF